MDEEKGIYYMASVKTLMETYIIYNEIGGETIGKLFIYCLE